MKRKIAIGIIAGGLICAAIFIPSIVRNVKFNKAVTLIESGNYAKLKEGIEIFETIKEKNENRIEEYLNVYVISSYGLLFVSTLLTLYAYTKVKLSTGIVLETISYILIPILSYFILKEKIEKR